MVFAFAPFTRGSAGYHTPPVTLDYLGALTAHSLLDPGSFF
jgi:hypothetical protein